MLNEDRHSQMRFSKAQVMDHLRRCYSKTIFKYHSDKGGNGSAEGVHNTKNIFRMFKSFYAVPFEIPDSSDDDTTDTDAHGCEYYTKNDLEDTKPRPETVYNAECKDDRCERVVHLLQAPEEEPVDTQDNFSKYAPFVNSYVTKKFWFVRKKLVP